MLKTELLGSLGIEKFVQEHDFFLKSKYTGGSGLLAEKSAKKLVRDLKMHVTVRLEVHRQGLNHELACVGWGGPLQDLKFIDFGKGEGKRVVNFSFRHM